MNKKGSPLDSIYIAVSFFAFALVLLVVTIFWNNVTTTELDTEIWNKNTYTTNMKADGQKAVDNFDNLAIIAYVSLHLGALVLAFMLRSHPIVFVVVFIVSLILAIVAVPLSNTWQDIVEEEPEFRTAISSYPKTNYILYNFPKFEVLWCIITGITMFGLSRMEEEY
jgi:hypothetical protein